MYTPYEGYQGMSPSTKKNNNAKFKITFIVFFKKLHRLIIDIDQLKYPKSAMVPEEYYFIELKFDGIVLVNHLFKINVITIKQVMTVSRIRIERFNNIISERNNMKYLS